MHLFTFPPDLHLSFGHAVPKRTRHVIQDAPGCMRGLKILFASDLHIAKRTNVAALVDQLRCCNADLILLGGDYADAGKNTLRFLRAAKSLKAPLGVFGVLGNNDREAIPSVDDLCAAFSENGWELLVNRCVELKLKDGSLFLYGVDEAKYGEPQYKGAFAAARPCDYRVLLSHYPTMPQFDAANRPNLMLSGHTHGGQFNILGITPFSFGFETMGEKKRLASVHVSGVKQLGETKLIVSKGVGTSRLPIRIGVRPEIHEIEFQ